MLQRAKLLVTVLAVTLLMGCSQLVGLLKPGGINANAQLGKENTQQVVANQKVEEVTVTGNTGETSVVKAESAVVAEKVDKVVTAASTKAVVAGPTVAPSVVSEHVEQIKTSNKAQEVVAGPGSQVIVNQTDRYPAWLILLLVIGWVLPTPVAILNWVLNKFRRSN
jgi:hypothetical protein